MKLLRLAVSFLLFPLAAGVAQALSTTPVKNFRLPTFTPEGYRASLLLGSEAVAAADSIQVTDLNLTLFTGDSANRVETVILSPAARATLDRGIVQGDSTVRLIRDDFEVTGTGWVYDHRQKKVSIARSSRVVFHAQMPDLLK